MRDSENRDRAEEDEEEEAEGKEEGHGGGGGGRGSGKEEKGEGERGKRLAGSPTSGDSSDPPGPVLSALEEWKFLCDEGQREGAILQWNRLQSANSQSNRGMERVELYKAFALSKCTYVKKLFVGKSVSSDTKEAWSHLPDFIPPALELDGDLLPVDPAVIRHLVEVGHDESLVELREVTSLISPVRYYSVPWYPAFCVVAKKAIKKGTFVLTYAGELEREIRNRDSVYVYDMPAEHVRAQWPDYPHDMPDLVIDAEKYGGVARFVNDSRYRAEEALGGAEGCTQNLESSFVFLEHCVHLCFYTTRDLKAKEELISHYGDAFWEVCTGQMLNDHQRYYQHIHRYHQHLTSLCADHQLPLPTPPSYLLESSPLFTRKVTRYACEAKPSDTTPVEEEWEVECILSKGRMYHQMHYLVKWLHFDDSYNSWIPQSA